MDSRRLSLSSPMALITRLADPEMEKNMKIKPENEVEIAFEKMLEKYDKEMEAVL